MILTGDEIEREWKQGRITIHPFINEQVNPNSYNFRLGPTLRVYSGDVLDAGSCNEFSELEIPEEGLVLEPDRLYLAHTIEVLGSDHYAPTFAARSSIARLGIFINLSASLGDIGYKGQWTLQLYTINRVRVYAGINIGQMMWWKPTGRIELYNGKYQGAIGPRVSDIHKDFYKQFARQRLPSLRAEVDQAEVGPKFAALAESCRRFRVPQAFCVPAADLVAAIDPETKQELASAFTDLQATVGAFFTESVTEIARLAEKVIVPPDLRKLIETRVHDLFGSEPGPLAVRSSGIEEDTEKSSLAGVHDTVLGVSAADVVAAVERCWRSWFAPAAVAARVRLGQFDPVPKLAVIVQEQVAPLIAGVAFTEPSDDGQPVSVVVEYIEGLADRLVSGVEVPVRVRSDDLTGAHTGVNEVVALARSLRAARGDEVDVEWALAEDGLYLIQVRPNTATARRAEVANPVMEIIELYGSDRPSGFDLGAVAEIYGTYTVKRGPAYRLAAESDIATGRGWVVRLNYRGLQDTECCQRLAAALADGHAPECVLDAGGGLRQMVLPKNELVDRLVDMFGMGADGTQVHTVILRDFVRGQLGVITRPTGTGLVLDHSSEGLMSLNRGTAGATTVTVADRATGGGISGDLGPLLPHIAELSRFTDVMYERYGDCTLEWVWAHSELFFVDYSVLGSDPVVVTASGAVVVSAGVARGRLMRLTEDDLLARLSTGPAVSIEKSDDVSHHKGLAEIVERVTSAPEPPVIHASRPYAVLSVLIGHVAGFVFDQGSVLGHLPILLREAGVPAVSASGFTGEGEIVINDGTITFAIERGHS